MLAINLLTLLGLACNPAISQMTVLDRTKLKASTYALHMATTDPERWGYHAAGHGHHRGAQSQPVELTTFAAEVPRPPA